MIDCLADLPTEKELASMLASATISDDLERTKKTDGDMLVAVNANIAENRETTQLLDE